MMLRLICLWHQQREEMMAPASKRSLRSLQAVIENASPEALRQFFCQEDENFAAIASAITEPLQALGSVDTYLIHNTMAAMVTTAR